MHMTEDFFFRKVHVIAVDRISNMELESGIGRNSKMKLLVSCGTKVECTIPDRLQGQCGSSDNHKTQLGMKLET